MANINFETALETIKKGGKVALASTVVEGKVPAWIQEFTAGDSKILIQVSEGSVFMFSFLNSHIYSEWVVVEDSMIAKRK